MCAQVYALTGRRIPRQSNIELLRIFSMIIIIAHHFSFHSGFEFSNDTITINKLWIQFIQIGGKIGVNVFVLISGYFLISSKSLKMSKVIKLWMQIFSYSIAIFVLFIATGIEHFKLRELIKHLFPISFSQWWFASSYFVLYLILPYINKFLNSFDKKDYQQFLILLTICWCFIPTFTGQSFQSNDLLWFVYLYAFAGYIKLYSSKTNENGITYILLSFAVIILTFFSVFVFDILGMETLFFGDHFGMQKFPILVISIFMFTGFLKINIGYSRIINLVSSATFGVYLIHDDKYVRQFLWHKIFKNNLYLDSSFLILYSLIVVIVVFVFCTFVELLRIYLLEKHYISLINYITKIIDACKERLCSISFFDKI